MDLEALLAAHAPFDALAARALAEVAQAAELRPVDVGDVVLDAFAEPSAEVFVVVDGQIGLWHRTEGDDDREGGEPDERLGPGRLFGFSTMLTQRAIGPRAVALTPGTVARIPGTAVLPAFASARGARFLAEQVSTAIRRLGTTPGYTLVDDLIPSTPVLVGPTATAAEVAQTMTRRDQGYAVVPLDEGRFGLITDASLRTRILVQGRSEQTPAHELADPDPPVVSLGDTAAEALIAMFDADSDYLLVLDRTGHLRGVVTIRDVAASPTTAGVSIHEQLRRARSTDALEQRARGLPDTLADLLVRGLAPSRVLKVYSSMLDSTLRRALELAFASRPELSLNAFTWLSLGSNGRGEAVLSSDLDSAAAFRDDVDPEQLPAYREAFAAVEASLARAGIGGDAHGATASRAPFARTNADWWAAARGWLAAPQDNQGAVMTSLLVDGRPIHGDPGLPAATRVFADLRSHELTMRLLLQESLVHRAKLRSVKDLLRRRHDTFDIKTNALLPIVNIARWAALSVGSAVLPTTQRLQAAAGSAMLPSKQADTLVEVFEVLQQIRLESQLEQRRRGQPAADVIELNRRSPLDRSVIASAVHEIGAVQRRMDNVAVYLPPAGWVTPEPA